MHAINTRISFPNARSITYRASHVHKHALRTRSWSEPIDLPILICREKRKRYSRDHESSPLADKAPTRVSPKVRRSGASAVSRERVQAVIHESTRRPPLGRLFIPAHWARTHESPPPRGRCRETQWEEEGRGQRDIFPLIPKERVRSDDTDGRYRVSGTRLVRAAARSPDVARTRIPEVEPREAPNDDRADLREERSLEFPMFQAGISEIRSRSKKFKRIFLAFSVLALFRHSNFRGNDLGTSEERRVFRKCVNI